jgi:NADH-ubiquinone oxidoreductase chain 5
MYTTLLVLPFVGSILAGLLGRKVGTTGAQLITTTCMSASAVLAIVAFYEVALAGSPVMIHNPLGSS